MFLGLLLSGCFGTAPPAATPAAPPPRSAQLPAPIVPEPSAVAAEQVAMDPEIASMDQDMVDAEAAADEERRQEWLAERLQHLEEFLAVVLPLDEPLADLATRWNQTDDRRMDFSVREYRGATTVSFLDATQASGSAWSETRTVFRRGRRTLEIRFAGNDEGHVQDIELDGPLTRSSRRDLGAAFGTRILRRPGQPLYGLARLFLGVDEQPVVQRDPAFSVVGPLYESGSRLAVFPLPAGEGELTPSMLFEQPSGVIRVSPVHHGCGAGVVGRHGLMRCRLTGSKGGHAFALRRLNEQTWQWVLETRLAMQGYRMEWAGEHRGFIFGHYGWAPQWRHSASTGLVAIRVRDGAAFRIDVPGVYENGREVEHLAERRRRQHEYEGCLNAARAAQSRNRLRPADYQGCGVPRWDTLSWDEEALLVGRHDGSVARLPFDRLLPALR